MTWHDMHSNSSLLARRRQGATPWPKPAPAGPKRAPPTTSAQAKWSGHRNLRGGQSPTAETKLSHKYKTYELELLATATNWNNKRASYSSVLPPERWRCVHSAVLWPETLLRAHVVPRHLVEHDLGTTGRLDHAPPKAEEQVHSSVTPPRLSPHSWTRLEHMTW